MPWVDAFNSGRGRQNLSASEDANAAKRVCEALRAHCRRL